jgi:putative tryptophan/tyrosine transport system substrate-binding protein
VNNRRKLVIALSAGALAVPFDSFGQPQAGMAHRIGFLGSETAENSKDLLNALREGLRDVGLVEGKNLLLESRWGDGDYKRLPAMALELAKLPVEVLVVHGPYSTGAAHEAGVKIPIVIATAGNDPLAKGWAKSLARPGGNITGSISLSSSLYAKQLELLKETLPRIRRIGFLGSSSDAESTASVQSAASLLQLGVIRVSVSRNEDIVGAISSLVKQNVEAILVRNNPFLLANARTVLAHIAKSRLPAVGGPTMPEAGALLGYGANRLALYRRAGYFVDKILKGSNAGDIPMEQPTLFDLIINLQTAKTLGIKIPQSILVQATKVIE